MVEGCLTALGTDGSVTGPSFTGIYVGSRPKPVDPSATARVCTYHKPPFNTRPASTPEGQKLDHQQECLLKTAGR